MSEHDNQMNVKTVNHQKRKVMVSESGAGKYNTIPWTQDPELLARMETIALLNLKGFSIREIARELGLGHITVEEDLKKLRAVRAAILTSGEIEELRSHSLDQLRLVQREAWDRIKFLDKGSRVAPELLNQITAAEREIMRLEGTIKHEQQVTPFSPELNIQIINDLGDRLARFSKSRLTAGIPEVLESGGSEGAKVLLESVGTTTAITSGG